MNTNIIRTAALAALLACWALPVFAAASPLGVKIKAINKDLKILKAQIADPAQKGANIQIVADLKQTTLDLRGMEPAKLQQVPAVERVRFMADYKAALGEMLGDIDGLDKALHRSDADESKALLKKIAKEKNKINSTYIKAAKKS